MKHPVIVGLQYGDEGKGKLTDSLARQADWVIRFNGGNNAGHTLWLNGKKLVTHSVPSGVRAPHAKNFIGAGCVIDPTALKLELEELNAAGASLSPERLKIDFRAHVTLPLQLKLDRAREASVASIGTTRRGIGPTYTTKTDRSGLRVGQIVEGDVSDRLRELCRAYNGLLKAHEVPESSVEENLAVVEASREMFRKYVSFEINPFFDISKTSKCLLEGAQAIGLDIDHGNYPFVTSSNTLPAYASVGTPFPLSKLGKIYGVAKAYLTRVGQGPFVTELHDETGERLRHQGAEFGATTGRPRRVGWVNFDELRTAVRLADCQGIVLTKADVLSGEVRIFAMAGGQLRAFEGWPQMTTEGDKLHPNVEAFIQAMESFVGVPVAGVGTGPDRADLIWRGTTPDFWAD